MKKIKVLSQGEILDSKCGLSNTLVISYNNTTDYSIVEKQKISFVTNADILKYEGNIFILRKDDIQKLTKFDYLKHKIRPYSNIFNKEDCKNIIDFLVNNDFKNKDIIFQCEYGKSRSLTTAICLYNLYLKSTHELDIENNIIRNKVIEDVIINYFKKNKK